MWHKSIYILVASGIFLGTRPACAYITDAHSKVIPKSDNNHMAAKNKISMINKLVNAAYNGNPMAQNWLGIQYRKNHHYAKANDWFKKSAEQGNADAQYNLGIAYYEGYGVQKNYTKANGWFKKAAAQGNADGQQHLGYDSFVGLGMSKDYANAIYWWKKAAAQGNSDAQNNLGHAYFFGQGVPKDQVKVIYWYKKAAAQGNAEAENNLGHAYYFGDGVQKDYAKAISLYKKAAAQGNADAQNNLGIAYSDGYGVQKNYTKANYWFKKAATQGDANAQANLGDAYYSGFGLPRNYTNAIYWWKKSAEQGNDDARHNLSILLTLEKINKDGVHSPLKLFGVILKGASRVDLESAISKAGFTPHNGHIGRKWRYDQYDYNSKKTEARELVVGYTQDERFAYAEIIYPSSNDSEQVRHIIQQLVSPEFGLPSTLNGNYDVGNVCAVWHMNDDMEVKVYRGWPNTTTFLDFTDAKAQASMKYWLKMRHHPTVNSECVQ